MAGDDSAGPVRGGGSERVWSGHRGRDVTGASVDASVEAQALDAPMGLARYLQVIVMETEGEVTCGSAPAVDDSLVDAGSRESSDPIDLDRNGEADLCQLRRGDLDLNGRVDQGDVAVLMQLIGTDPFEGIGDLDADGCIDAGDVALLLTRFA